MQSDVGVCPVCDENRWQEDIFCLNTLFLRCSECGLGKTAIVRTASDWIRENNDFYNSEQVDRYVDRIHDRSQTIRSLDTALWIIQRAKLRGPGELLDVGCSSGSILAAFHSLGWHVRGVEPTIAVKNVPDHLQSCVQQCLFGEETFAGPFRLITAFHVLEHVPDPVAFVTRCRDRLEPGGSVVIEVPDFEYSRRLIHKYGTGVERDVVSHLSPNFHVHHFTRQSLTALMAKVGLKKQWCGLTTPVLASSGGEGRGAGENLSDSAATHQGIKQPNFQAPSMRTRLKKLLWEHQEIRIRARCFIANRLGFGSNVAIIAKKPG